ncbi:hypothetical protein TRICI_002135 [Trichomonascus ciferrii]|uniref:Tyrosyl-DNA phosphodiesterase n=1 Tax=Trichomonascus ciferrii TaxID=44093 RepID=A0A642V6N1_9ASCO|nr:hypothetical protein TRICI_002135 [Trichomonascus ciferrii]
MSRREESDDEVVEVKRRRVEMYRSPLKLIRAEESVVKEQENVDTVSLAHLVGQRDLVEIYQFSFEMDLAYAMDLVHPEARPNIKAYFVFGKSRKGDMAERLEEQRKTLKYNKNITLVPIPLRYDYGTHHSKLMVLFFSNNEVQITIHTANLISYDWENMTQGIWVSPRMSLKGGGEHEFKTDFVDYIRAYKNPCLNKLADSLESVNFDDVQNVSFIGSVPGNYEKGSAEYKKWGALKLYDVVSRVEKRIEDKSDPELIVQMSSIGSLGPLSSYFNPILKRALLGQEPHGTDPTRNAKVSIIFPSLMNIRESLFGYGSGGSIHFPKDEKGSLQKELRPMLCQWKAKEAGRQILPPHIKTYTRLTKERKVAWMVLTSANLSKQAWGIVNKTKKNQWIQSWEAGVILSPPSSEPFTPLYKRDTSTSPCVRLPFDIPPSPYEDNDEVWSAKVSHSEPDRFGNIYVPR